MSKKNVYSIVLVTVLIGVLGVAFKVHRVDSQSGTIYIRATGEVEGTDKIERMGELYAFTGNITDCITIEKNNIAVDGGGFTLDGALPTYFAGIYLRGKFNVTIRNLAIKRFRYGVIVSSSSNISVLANNITVGRSIGYQTGVYLLNSSKNTVSRNRFSNNTRGIFLASSQENNVSRNEIADNESGISFEHSSNNNILENNVINNIGGVLIEYTSHNNSIQRNNLITNDIGIILSYGSSMNSIFRNNITSSKNYGILILDSLENSIHHNCLVENANQVNINTLSYSNSWDDGREGNYWSDYTEIYPNATEVDGSGVWDTAYVIDANNQDNYPIVPEFPSFAILSLFMIITLLAVMVCKKRAKSDRFYKT